MSTFSIEPPRHNICFQLERLIVYLIMQWCEYVMFFSSAAQRTHRHHCRFVHVNAIRSGDQCSWTKTRDTDQCSPMNSFNKFGHHPKTHYIINFNGENVRVSLFLLLLLLLTAFASHPNPKFIENEWIFVVFDRVNLCAICVWCADPLDGRLSSNRWRLAWFARLHCAFEGRRGISSSVHLLMSVEKFLDQKWESNVLAEM